MHVTTPPEGDEPSALEQSETMLVLLAQTGDRGALETLLRQLHAPLRHYIVRLAGADLADDIVQETSLQIFRRLPSLREPSVVRPWALRIASRLAFRQLRRARLWQPLDEASAEPHLPTPNLGEPPDAEFLELVDQVSPGSRAVLLLHFQHGLTLDETAAVLEIPVGTAKSRLAYGVNTLRKHLQERNHA